MSGSESLFAAACGLATAALALPISAQTELAKLHAADPAADQYFGSDVAVDGARVLLGASGHDLLGMDRVGAAYWFDLATLSQRRMLQPSDASADQRFGVSVAVRGDLALVGAPANGSSASTFGAAYRFRLSTGE